MKIRSSFFFVMTLLTFGFTLIKAEAADAKSFIETLGKEAIETLTRPNTADEQIEEQFVRLLDRDFAVSQIASFVLGKYNREASSDQKEKFKSIFRERLKKSYAARFKQYRGVKFDVQSANIQGDKADVKSTIQEAKPNAPVVKVDWKIKKIDGNWKIFDVYVDGVSMATTLRSEYASAITQKGGIDGFIQSKS